jgi:tRNA 2-thiocytidine biosynthesis protein TtcA
MRDIGKALLARAYRTIDEYGMIEPGDRVLVAVSGGKDSTALAWALSKLRRSMGFEYSVSAIHISTDFCACCKKGWLSGLLDEWEVPFEDAYVPVIGRLKEGRKMNCFWCSTQRRNELIARAINGGFSKIALGHHMDDILSTFLMNLTEKGRLSPMAARLDYDKYPVSIIRPFARVEEREIVEFAESMGFRSAACTCPYGKSSSRKDARASLEALTGGSAAVKRRVYEALLELDPPRKKAEPQ